MVPSDEYMSLVREFPLKLIGSARSHKSAMEMIRRLAANPDLKEGSLDYFKVLVRLVEDYEKQTFPFEQSSPGELLAGLMEVNNLRAVDLAEMVIPSHISAILKGSRKISKAEAAKLGAFFKIDPAAFLEKVLPFEPKRQKKVANVSKPTYGVKTATGAAPKTASNKAAKSGSVHVGRKAVRSKDKSKPAG